jgi:hypothetical protein
MEVIIGMASGKSLENLAAQQQQEQEEPILWPIETHDPQEIPAAIYRYLQRSGDIDPDWERTCSAATLLQGKQPLFLILKRNLKSLQMIQRQQKMIQPTLTIHSQGTPLISNAYIFTFYYEINVI